MRVFLAFVFLAATHAAPYPARLTARDAEFHHRPSANAFFLDNNVSGSSIISLSIGQDGTLSNPVRTSTGGFGAVATNGTGFPNAADTLISQGAVTVGGNLLFTVNAGSNTIATFRLQPGAQPSLIGTTDTLGSFPVSVAYSEKENLACVLNGGAKAGVACFRVDFFGHLFPIGPLRSLGAFHETTPPTGPPNSASQILFNPDSSAVFAIVKGNPGVTPASIFAWPINNGFVASNAVQSQIGDMPLDFGSVFLSETRLLVSDPSYGVSILDISNGLKTSEEVHTVVAGQQAICWTAYDPVLDKAYAPDAGAPVVHVVNPASGALEGTINAEADAKGVFDSAIGPNNFMYSLAGSDGVLVFNLAAGTQAQYLNLTSFGARQGYQGMALFFP